MSAPELSARLGIREFSRAAGCDEKQVRRAIGKGLLHKGLDGLLAASDIHGAWRKPNRRTITKPRTPAADNPQVVRKSADTSSAADNTASPRQREPQETPAEAAERIVRSQGLLSLEEALRLKENYLGRLKQLEYDLKAGAVVPSAMVLGLVGQEYARVRTRLLAIPAERAPALHRVKTVAEVQDLLLSVITEALEELSKDGASAPV